MLIKNAPHKWLLGVFSTLQPKQIFTNIMQILRKMHFEWKVIGPYLLRCRPTAPDTDQSTPQKQQQPPAPNKNPKPNPRHDSEYLKVRISIQLFKLGLNAFLIDFKVNAGAIFPFFEVMGEFLQYLPTSMIAVEEH